jgi:hypothetical protein
MGDIGVVILLVGIVTVLVGIAGFVDTRKVDRRYKTGYKYNEPDRRSFGRAGKRLLYGIGISIAGCAVLGLSSPSQRSAPAASSDGVASQPGLPVASDANASNPVVALDSQQTEHQPDNGVTLGSNERVIVDENVPASNRSETATSAGTQAQDASPQPSTANFGCADDGTFFGANVCKSATLAAAYDRELNAYNAAQGRIGGKDVGVRIEQQNWVEKTIKDCPDMVCLTQAFDTRMADLQSRYRKGG